MVTSISTAKKQNFNDKLYKFGRLYLKQDFPVIPAKIGDKKYGTYIKWKPYQKRQPSEKQILKWIQNYPEKWPDMGWAIVTGKISDIIVLDIDPGDGGEKTLDNEGLFIPKTVTVSSGGGGKHYYFKYPKTEYEEVRCFRGNQLPKEIKLPGIDLRADRGIIFAPPSNHPSGGNYQFVEGYSLKDCEIAETPDWLLDFIDKRKGFKVKNSSDKKQNKKLDWHSQQKRFSQVSEGVLTHVELIKDKNIEELKNRLNPDGKITKVKTKKELENCLYSLDIAKFLGFSGNKGEKFNCLFHNDTDPSAHVYETDDGHFVYKCFGDCNFDTGNIIQVVKAINPELSKLDIIEMIKDIYGIVLSHSFSSPYRKLKKLLQKNKMRLLDTEFGINYPNLNKIIWKFCNLKEKRNRQQKIIDSPSRYKDIPSVSSYKMFMHPNYCNQLLLMHVIAEDYIWDNELKEVTVENTPTFFASVNYISKRFSKIFGDTPPRNKVCQRNNLFTFLGLLKKVDPDNLPERFYARSKEVQENNNYKYINNYFMIPPYDKRTLRKADLKAKKFLEYGGTIKAFKREYIYRTFGKKEADRVYPQLRDEPLQKNVDKMFKKAKIVIKELIDKQGGYCSEKQILNHTSIKKLKMNNKKGKLKRCIGQLMKAYGLKKVQTNKKIKDKYNMTELKENSFPKVLMLKK